jgi:hypothetical protein
VQVDVVDLLPSRRAVGEEEVDPSLGSPADRTPRATRCATLNIAAPVGSGKSARPVA